MSDDREQREEKNRAILESLRETFAPMLERLSTEIGPATVYVLHSREMLKDSE